MLSMLSNAQCCQVNLAMLAALSGEGYTFRMPVESAMGAAEFGRYLKSLRQAVGLTLRQVEERTNRVVKNGYLSQIEGGVIQKPSPGILYELSRAYGADYRDLLQRAGIHVPEDQVPEGQRAIPGLPLHALQDLTPVERQQLIEYAAFLRQRRPRS
jgi:transcriptional regulator with XRE-family HTH domain